MDYSKVFGMHEELGRTDQWLFVWAGSRLGHLLTQIMRL
jgi:hypothetical protein